MIIKKKVLFFALGLVLCFVSIAVFFTAVLPVFQPKPTYTIVIDAGHGGIDGGAIGKTTGITESELNLVYAKMLKQICEEYGMKVVMTRSDMAGLYNETAKSKKKSEMEKRKEIIKKANPDFVVSIHMNSFGSESVRGAHVFYAEGSTAGEALAQSIADVLSKNISYAHKNAKIGDYYVLNCTSNPSVLVECGFLSNAEEEVLLQDEKYIHDFCYNVFCGIYNHFRF